MKQETKEKIGMVFRGIGRGFKRFGRRIRKMSRVKKMVWGTGIVMLALGLFVGNFMGRKLEAKKAEKALQETIAKVTNDAKDATQNQLKKTTKTKDKDKKKKAELDWNLQLVNETHPMDPAYVPELTVITGEYSVDTRIAQPLNQMLTDAQAAGLNMHICSAYRGFEKQTQVFNDTVVQNLGGGEDYLTAYNTTKQSVALPGTSEHAMGFSLDIVSNAYENLDDQQASTPEAQWLKENCAKYGFILRYPPEKSGETGIIYEPWHYRYVGIEDAEKIMKSGETLEAYLKANYGVE